MLRTLILTLLLLPIVIPARATDYTRQQIIVALSELPSATAQQDFKNPQLAPTEKDPYLLSLEKIATDKSDPELVQALLQYQFAYRSPDNPLPARVLGKVFLEQPETVMDVYYKMPAAQRIVLYPYLVFGYEKATDGKNRSLPKLVACQQKLDRLHGNLMNARSRDDANPLK